MKKNVNDSCKEIKLMLGTRTQMFCVPYLCNHVIKFKSLINWHLFLVQFWNDSLKPFAETSTLVKKKNVPDLSPLLFFYFIIDFKNRLGDLVDESELRHIWHSKACLSHFLASYAVHKRFYYKIRNSKWYYIMKNRFLKLGQDSLINFRKKRWADFRLNQSSAFIHQEILTFQFN